MYSEQQGLETLELSVVIEYNVPVIDHHIRYGCNTDTSNDHISFVTETERDPQIPLLLSSVYDMINKRS